ncbi:hypothetical protein [Pedobacter sp.]|uniref:hypothetical protein n=1 Tax=Pedobacter sp. TaxID=1411316 RepID=UPI003D7FE106
MSKRYNIQNLEQLQAQLFMLKSGYTEKGSLLTQNVKLYVKQYTLGSLIRKYATPNALLKIDDKMNISSKVMSFVLPVIMNSTFFRGSGFMTKALVGLATSKMGKTLDAEHISAMFNTVKGLFNKAKKTRKPGLQVDYGIPPDSETF